jgi:hypothetical protein
VPQAQEQVGSPFSHQPPNLTTHNTLLTLTLPCLCSLFSQQDVMAAIAGYTTSGRVNL